MESGLLGMNCKLLWVSKNPLGKAVFKRFGAPYREVSLAAAPFGARGAMGSVCVHIFAFCAPGPR